VVHGRHKRNNENSNDSIRDAKLGKYKKLLGKSIQDFKRRFNSSLWYGRRHFIEPMIGEIAER